MPISFAETRIKHLYSDIEFVARTYPGFNLSELKDMAPRERRYWTAMADYHAERARKE